MGDGLLSRGLGALVPFAVFRYGFLGVFAGCFLRRDVGFLGGGGARQPFERAEEAVVRGRGRWLALAFPAAFLVFSAPTFFGMVLEGWSRYVPYVVRIAQKREFSGTTG